MARFLWSQDQVDSSGVSRLPLTYTRASKNRNPDGLQRNFHMDLFLSSARETGLMRGRSSEANQRPSPSQGYSAVLPSRKATGSPVVEAGPAAALSHLPLDCTNDMHYTGSYSFLCPCSQLFAVLYNKHKYNSVETTSNMASTVLLAKGRHAHGLARCSCARTYEVSMHHPSDATEAHLFHCNSKLHRSCNKQAQNCDHNILYTGNARQNIPFTEHMHHASKIVIQLSPQVCVDLLARPPTSYNMLHQVSSP